MMNETNEPKNYVIQIKGHLSQQWLNRFENMTIVLTDAGETHLIGKVADQAALHGLLRAIRDSGLELLAVNHSNEQSGEDEETWTLR